MNAGSERKLPYDLNAEAAVLSAMMLDSYNLARGLDLIDDENCFYRENHKIIFIALKDMFTQQIEVDLITMMDFLDQKNLLDKVGGKEYLIELEDVVSTGAHLEHYATIVKNKALIRQLILTSTKIVEDCYTSDKSVDEVLDSAEQAIYSIAERPSRQSFMKLDKVLQTTINQIDAIAKSKKGYIGIPSDYIDLDRKLGGFRNGQLIVIAARPSMGKTSLAINIAHKVATNHNKTIAIFTMEMAAEEIVMRLLSMATGIRLDSLLKGRDVTQDTITKIINISNVLDKQKLYIDDTGSNTILDIRAKARRLQSEQKELDLIIVDYMQLLSVKRNRENRQQEIAEISRSLKILAKDLQIPIIALSQLNRGVETRDDKRPKLADLRESGAIEQDADIVLFIYRDEVYNKDSMDENIAEIIIGKNRQGPIGTVELFFKKETTSFENYMRPNEKSS
jgi:replicative DNA helicase